MGNKSKRIQGKVFILDTRGLPCGTERIDAGYSGSKKERHFRECSTKVTYDFETAKRLRREVRRAKKLSPTSRHEQPAVVAVSPAVAERR